MNSLLSDAQLWIGPAAAHSLHQSSLLVATRLPAVTLQRSRRDKTADKRLGRRMNPDLVTEEVEAKVTVIVVTTMKMTVTKTIKLTKMIKSSKVMKTMIMKSTMMKTKMTN